MPKKKKKTKLPVQIAEIDAVSLKMTRWIGSIPSLIAHTIIFAFCFIIVLLGAPLDRVLLVLTTIVSLEAIYLAIFIQMSVNKNTADIDVIQEDVEEIAEDIEEMEKDVDEIQKDIDEIQEDVDEIAEDVDEIQVDVDEIAEDVDEIAEEVVEDEEGENTDGKTPARHKEAHPEILEKIQHVLEALAKDVEALKNKEK
ncbi:MAG: DUF1003 domain-containing protein [Candidatus Pacebacteria bacterium]|nr:DUF1003 domain-containing protein [Candidatus Paceibacterota bacterium]